MIGALTFLLVCFRANFTSSTARGLDLLTFSTITGLLIISMGRFISPTNFSASRFMSSLTGMSLKEGSLSATKARKLNRLCSPSESSSTPVSSCSLIASFTASS